MWSILVFVVCVTTSQIVIESVEIVHDTDYLPNAQYFDCLHYTNKFTNTHAIKYCVQPKDVSNFQRRIDRNESARCEKGAITYSFSSLFEKSIHPSVVLSTFHSGIEQADRYGAYFSHRQVNNSYEMITDDFVCNCSSLEGVFGRYCEYEFYVGSTLIDTIRAIKLNNREDVLFGQFQRQRVCYISIDCDYGLLCLDWRDICDGVQNCMDGVDEENCDEVEINECAKNEFRCLNGLCIPEEYWLDGEFDCQDASDELAPPSFDSLCPEEKGMECDEHVCEQNFYLPCGDGRCSASYVFYKGQITVSREKRITFVCSTLRDLAFHCEIHEPLPMWTLTGGFCIWVAGPWGNIRNKTIASECEFLLKCYLSRSLSTICPPNDTLSMLLSIQCKSNLDRIKYPSGSALGPRIYTFYKIDHQLIDGFLPDYITIKGQLRCAGFHLAIDDYEPGGLAAGIIFLGVPFAIEFFLCYLAERIDASPEFVRNYSTFAPHFDTSCWHKWLSLLNLSSITEVTSSCKHTCLSTHRINNGITDCMTASLEETTVAHPRERYNNHCLNCIAHTQQAICLPIIKINSEESICTHGEDTYLAGTSVAIRTLKCANNDASDCHIIRDYISQSSAIIENKTLTDSIIYTSIILPFGQYCDTYFDMNTGNDEAVIPCLHQWTCAKNEYRCLTGQCIPSDWLCDGEWDCTDASDEQRLFLQVNDFVDEHNRLLFNFAEVKMSCLERYSKQAFSNICNITREYPCLLANVNDPLNFTLNRPCIKLEQIADGYADCLGKSDERNLLKCGSDVLGWSFGCTGANNECKSYTLFCVDPLFNCPKHDNDNACFYKNSSSCNGPNDVMCLNGVCQRDARCNHKWDCLNGEDEYWCYFDPERFTMGRGTYRNNRRVQRQSRTVLTQYLTQSNSHTYRLHEVPSIIDQIQQILMTLHAQKRIYTVDSNYSDDEIIDELLNRIREDPKLMLRADLPFVCNRGIPIKHTDGHTQCLCSPSHFGDYCEFQSDRISVVTHLNLTKFNENSALVNTKNSSILVSCTFRYAERIIDRHDFHIHPIAKYEKQKFYFAYPRTREFQKQHRTQPNGTKLYSIRFEVFYLLPLFNPILLAVWHFPIYFDFLPAFRFAKVLHFNDTNQNYTTCNLFCGLHGKCFRLENEIKQLICSCQSGWHGDRCNQYDKQCEGFCHPHALCRPQERGFINGDQRPICICPNGWFGPTCHLTYPACTQCQNDGSCYRTYDRSHTQPFKCICTNDFYGDYCQFPKHAVHLRFDESLFSSKILATSIQYYDVKFDLIDLDLREQQIYRGQPIETQMAYEQDNSPSVILIKSYTVHYQVQGPIFYLIYSQQNSKAVINMTTQLTSENECIHTHILFGPKIIQSTTANMLVFKYNELCHHREANHSAKICFRDDYYFCLCNMTLQHAQCLRFNPYSDRCQHCLSGGQCIRGSLQRDRDFLCLCPRCMYGSVCQYSTQLFSFTLDSLIIKDVQSQQNLSIAIYILITSLVFLTGTFTNLCSLLVFSRKTPRQMGVGNYLLLVSIVNIISLLLFFMKIIHTLLGSAGLLINNTINLILCKSLSSLLSITIRINYWLISLITIERLSLVIFPTKTIAIKKPSIALLLSFITMLFLCAMHIHEILHYTIITTNPQEINSSAILCVTNFDNQSWSVYNRINVLIHHLVPFIIQIIAITLLIVWAAKSRARATSIHITSFSQILRKQFKTQKELYVTPAIIILAALPQLIFTLSFACTELNHAWQRYTLLITYLFSFIPQICGFIIFVLPSSSYKAELASTKIGQKLLRMKRYNPSDGHTRTSIGIKR